MVEELVRVMAGDAREPRIAIAPAAAFLEPIGLKAHVFEAFDPRLENIVGGAVTGAAKVHLRYGAQTPGIENSLPALGILFGVHEVGMLGAGTVTGFAIHAENKVRRIKSRSCGGSGGVTAKATAHRIRIKPLAERLIQGGRRFGRVARSQVQALETHEETHSAFVERAVSLKNVSLALVC